MASLYRGAALSARQFEQHYAVPWILPRLHLWALLLLVWVLLTLGVLGQLSYAKKISVQGAVQPLTKAVVVRSRQMGVVAEVYVSEHSQVTAGEALLLIDQRSLATDGASHDQLHVEQLRSQRVALQRQQYLAKVLADQEAQALHTQLRGVQQQQKILGDQFQVLQQQQALAQTDHQRLTRLAAEHYVSARDVQQVSGVQLAAQAAVLEQLARRQTLAQEDTQLRARLQLLALQAENRQADLNAQVQQLDHQIKRVSAQGLTTLAASIHGVVTDVLVQQGQLVSAGMALMSVVPPSSRLPQVEVYLPSTAAGRVRVGLEARLRFAGYPFHEYGVAKGKVSDVSQTNTAEDRQSFFRAKITVLSVPPGIDVLPAGMQVDVDVILQNQALWQWLLQPVSGAALRL